MAYEKILTILILIVIGYFSRRLGFIDEGGASTLNSLAVNVFLPAMVLVALLRMDRDELFLYSKLPLIVGTIILISFFVFYIIAHVLFQANEVKGAVVLNSVFGNVGFLGLPVIKIGFGEEGLKIAIFYLFTWFILFFTLGAGYSQKIGTDRGHSYGELISHFFVSTTTIAILLGFLFVALDLRPYPLIMDILMLLDQATVPVVMIALGVYLRLSETRKHLKSIWVVGMNKFLIMPLIAYLVCSLLGLGELISYVIIMESAMPPAIMNSLLVSKYSLDSNLSSTLIFFDTILSFAVISLFLLLML